MEKQKVTIVATYDNGLVLGIALNDSEAVTLVNGRATKYVEQGKEQALVWWAIGNPGAKFTIKVLGANQTELVKVEKKLTKTYRAAVAPFTEN